MLTAAPPQTVKLRSYGDPDQAEALLGNDAADDDETGR
jgi:hypothetical protein